MKGRGVKVSEDGGKKFKDIGKERGGGTSGYKGKGSDRGIKC